MSGSAHSDDLRPRVVAEVAAGMPRRQAAARRCAANTAWPMASAGCSQPGTGEPARAWRGRVPGAKASRWAHLDQTRREIAGRSWNDRDRRRHGRRLRDWPRVRQAVRRRRFAGLGGEPAASGVGPVAAQPPCRGGAVVNAAHGPVGSGCGRTAGRLAPGPRRDRGHARQQCRLRLLRRGSGRVRPPGWRR